jgi:crossover junction endodeoxyribonuclease RuvC
MELLSMMILGIDPGTRITGYGLIQVNESDILAIDYGSIKPDPHMLLTDRYLFISNGIDELIEKYKPNALVVETQYISKNPHSTMKLIMVRGIIIIAAKRKNIPVFEYAPTKAKLAVTGNGRSSKYEVQKMVQLLLKLSKLPTPEDAADALSLAICHANSLKFNSLISMEI